jgi:GxxExxY protein
MLRVASPLSDELEALIHKTIGSCIRVHQELGPGLMEKIYVRAVCIELACQQIPFESEKPFDVIYRGSRLWQHRLDIVVNNQLMLEIKAIERIAPLHQAQVLSSLRVAKLKVGLLLNFNVAVLPDGIKRVLL